MLKVFVIANSGQKANCHFLQNVSKQSSVKLCTSFTSHLHSSCGMVWYRKFRVNPAFWSLGQVPWVFSVANVFSVTYVVIVWYCSEPTGNGGTGDDEDEDLVIDIPHWGPLPSWGILRSICCLCARVWKCMRYVRVEKCLLAVAADFVLKHNEFRMCGFVCKLSKYSYFHLISS